MKISIVTICFNNVNEIRRTIESVVAQSYKDIEYVVVDGGSSDGTIDIINEYSGKVSNFLSEPDRNMYDAINKGLALASGDVVGLIHAGDRLYDTDTVKKIAAHFVAHDIDVMYGHSVMVGENDIPVRINKSPEYKRSLVKRGWMPSHQSIYVKRDTLYKYGLYKLDLHPSADYEFFLRYFYFNRLSIKRLDEYILRFSMGGMSTRNYLNNLRSQKQQIKCWEENGETPPFYLVPLKLLRKPKQFLLAIIYRVFNIVR